MGHTLSKSTFLMGLQCHKALWLNRYRKELIPELDDATLQRFTEGKAVGDLAKGLFPGGVEIPYEEDPVNMVNRTLEQIEAGITTIYEATFIYRDVLVRADILHKTPEGWKLYEVKSSTEVKEVYIDDVAIQRYVLEGAGLKVTDTYLVYINNGYVRKGDIDIDGLFTIADITPSVLERMKTIDADIDRLKEVLSFTSEPAIDIGPHCKNPYECIFWHYCRSHIPENSVFSINGLNYTKRFELYRNGIIDFKDIPEDYPLSPSQRLQVDAELNDIKVIDRECIRDFLSTLRYPLCFLDFETFQLAIPPFDGTKPYQQIPFLVSVHRIDEPEADLMHYDFLIEPGIDQRRELIQALIDAIPENACIIVYNAAFEKGILKSLADTFPEYRERLMNIYDNIVDLMEPFRNKLYYVKEMKGSYSLKAVVPVLLPELSYESLAISDGGQASAEYLKLLIPESEPHKEEIKENLKRYCRFDTYVMVKILERLREL